MAKFLLILLLFALSSSSLAMTVVSSERDFIYAPRNCHIISSEERGLTLRFTRDKSLYAEGIFRVFCSGQEGMEIHSYTGRAFFPDLEFDDVQNGWLYDTEILAKPVTSTQAAPIAPWTYYAKYSDQLNRLEWITHIQREDLE